MGFTKPMPRPTPTAEPFWDSLAEHRIRIQYSPSTDRYVFYPRALAPGTLADDLEWREISGAASLYTYTVAYRPADRHFAGDCRRSSPSCNGTRVPGSPPRSSTPNRTISPSECGCGRCSSTTPPTG